MKRIQLKVWRADQSHEKHFIGAPATIIPPQWKTDAKSLKYMKSEIELLGGFGDEYVFQCALGYHDCTPSSIHYRKRLQILSCGKFAEIIFGICLRYVADEDCVLNLLMPFSDEHQLASRS